MKSLKPRLLTAAIGIPAVVVIMLLSELWSPLVGIVVGLASLLMIGEFLYARRLLSCIPLAIVCMLYALAMPNVAIWGAVTYIITYVFFIAAFLVSLIYHKKLHSMNLAYALFGTLLISYGMSAVTIACRTNGFSVSFYFVLIFLLPWMADGGGYFIGSYFGKHKLCPTISPKKTVEGLLGGIVFCVASAMIMGLLFRATSASRLSSATSKSRTTAPCSRVTAVCSTAATASSSPPRWWWSSASSHPSFTHWSKL